MKTKKVNFRLTGKQLSQLKQVADKLNIPLSAYIRWAIAEGNKQAGMILGIK